MSKEDNEGKKPDKNIEIVVNNKAVEVHKNRITGLEIKQGAIEQGVPNVELDFQLVQVKANGGQTVVPNGTTVTVNRNSKFLMIAPDDNS
jgi:hypothetical protein